LTVKFIDVVLL